MNSKLLLISISIITLSSCSTAYKTGQTPDDVYYSPARFYDEDRKEDNKKDEDVAKRTLEDRQIRMAANNPRWRHFDNDISYSPYNYGYNYGYYYNPYYYPFAVYSTVTCVTPKNPKNTTPRMVALGGYGNGYNNTNNNAVNSKTGTYTPTPVRGYNNSNSNTGSRLGNTLNKIFNNSNSSSNSNSTNNSTQSSRTYTPSSSSSSSSSSSGSSSSGSSSRPARSGKGG